MTLFPKRSALPDFVADQRMSFRSFVETGIREELEFFSPITGRPLDWPTQLPQKTHLVVRFLANEFYLKPPKRSATTCLRDLKTYSSPLVVPVHIMCRGLGINRIVPLTFCELPLMTQYGSFIINGSPRVVVHQIVRCPGVYLKAQVDKKHRRTHLVSFLSAYGSWLRFKSDRKGRFWAYMDNHGKFPATLLLQSMGFSLATIKETVCDPSLLMPTFEETDCQSSEMALFELCEHLFPMRNKDLRARKRFLFLQFFHARRYSLSRVGRQRVNRKFRMHHTGQHLTLTPEDTCAAIDYLIRLENGESKFLDDIDHLKNRRVRLAGELIQTQFRLGLNRLERSIQFRLMADNYTSAAIVAAPISALVRTQTISSIFQEFFGSNQLSQFMDQTNPLAEVTHKRRLSSLGPGGLHRDRAGLIVRGIHPSYYGRICPIETPEGKNAGLVGSIATFARINRDGFLEAPYVSLQTQPHRNPDSDPGCLFLSALAEDRVVLAARDIQRQEKQVPTRTTQHFTESTPGEVDFLGISPIQFMSIATALIPFLEHDDANRALMGSNMQRQAVSLLTPQRAYVGTGLEGRLTRDSGALVMARTSGVILYADAQRIEYLRAPTQPGQGLQQDCIQLTQYQRSNQDTCIHHRPRPDLRPGSWVETGDYLADNASTWGGELALGKNILIAYMPWEGYNFEDAVLVSERLVFEDIFTSVHIERYDTGTCRTREGQEYITPNIEKNTHLDEFGVIRPGTWVEGGDILVGKISPQKDSENTPEGRLLRAIFGGTSRDFKETPLRLPRGVSGRILETRTFFEKQKYNNELQCFESVGAVYIYLVQKRKVQVGDKVAGRHGNKGIISNILPRQDMPFLENGTPVDMVLNPLGVPSRMNVGQIFECLLGLVGFTLGQGFKILPFDEMHGREVSRGFVYHKLYEARQATQQKWLFRPNVPGKSIVFDGRTGEPFDQAITVGYPYILKLVHLVDDKIHARSTGPYSMVTQQPLGGRSKQGGQRLGEMEVWALEGFGAAYTLQELLTIKSDDMRGRNATFMALIRGELIPNPGVPESFKVLICELRALCLDISLAKVDFQPSPPELLQTL